MTVSLTIAQLDAYDKLIQTNGVSAVTHVYGELYDKGFQYAGWASGVAQGNSVTGQAALGFLDVTALMGYGGQATQDLSQAQVDKIRVDMARQFLSTLKVIADQSGGAVNRDVTFKEAKAFHILAFQDNGLTINNWTLTIPFDLIQAEYGDSQAETIWEMLRDTGGVGPAAWAASGLLALGVFYFALNGEDAQTRNKALQWAEIVPSKVIERFSARMFDDGSIVLPWGNSAPPAGTAGLEDFQKALLTVVADYFDLQPSGSSQLFDFASGRLSFDFNTITPDLHQLRSLPLLAEALSKLDDKAAHFIRAYAQEAAGWNIQSGTGVLNWTSSSAANQAAVGGTGADVQTGGAGDDLLMGLAGADKLNGKAGSDLLVGGDGVDTLDGGDGSDHLYGGAGADTYVFSGDFGSDWITDSDGQGAVQVAGETLPSANAKKIGDGLYRDKATGWRFMVVGRQPDGTATLVIQKENDHYNSITVRDWMNGKLGITLSETMEEAPAATSIYKGDQRPVIYGVDIPADGNPSNTYAWSKVSWNTSTGALIGQSKAEANFGDVIKGSANKDDIQGLGGNDALSGGDGDDKIDGGLGDDLIGGGAGSDTIQGGAGNDQILGGLNVIAPQRVAPTDTWSPPPGKTVYLKGPTWGVYQKDENLYIIDGSGGVPQDDKADFIEGGAGNDRILASFGNDYVDGGADDDQIKGLAGKDVLLGGTGADDIRGDGTAEDGFLETTPSAQHGNDILDGGAGNDTLTGQGGKDQLFGGADDDSLWGDDSKAKYTALSAHDDDYLDGEDGNDQLVGGGKNDELFGGAGNDKLWGDDKQENVAGSVHGIDYLDGEDGDDYLAGGGKGDELFGGNGKDTLNGDDDQDYVDVEAHGNDYLDGEAGNDLLIGAGKDDELFGGKDNDTLLGDNSQDKVDISAHGNDYLDGEEGADMLVGGGKDDGLFGGSENDTLWGDDVQSRVSGSAHGSDYLDGGEGADYLIGGGRDDTLFGGVGDDTLKGDDDLGNLPLINHGADWLDGGSGNDDIYGYGGNDIIFGGIGNDWISGEDQSSTADTDQLSAMSGDDRLDGDAGRDTLLGGMGHDWLSGGLDEDLLSGGEGNDTLDGGNGSDTLTGGAGADTYIFSAGSGKDFILLNALDGAGDTILLNGIEKNNVSFGASNYDLTLSLNVNDRLVIADFFARSTDTLEFASSISLNAKSVAGELLRTSDGADSLNGFVFADFVNAAGGRDTINGYGGNDELDGGAEGDVVNGGNDNDTIYGGAGADTLYGDDGADVLEGGEGNDFLYGGNGRDIFVFKKNQGVDIIYGQQSEDSLRLGDGINFSDVSFERKLYSSDLDVVIRSGEIEIGRVTIVNQLLEQSASNNGIKQLIFNDESIWDAATIKNRALAGTDHNDTLQGYSSGDLINGFKGSDLIFGREGNDTLSGGEGDDTLYGNGANDILDGGSGNDYLVDTEGVNVFAFGIGDGFDSIVASYSGSDAIQFDKDIYPGDISFSRSSEYILLSLKTTGDRIRLEGTASLKFFNGETISYAALRQFLLNGTAASDSITGYGTNDTIFAYGGADSVRGGLGKDALNGGFGRDTLYGDEGDDLLSGDDGGDFLFGGEGNDFLVGGENQDGLYGDSGNDTLDGGAGDDVLRGGTGADTYLFGIGSGRDVVWRNLYPSGQEKNLPNGDIVKLGAGVRPEDIRLSRPRIEFDSTTTLIDDLIITINGTTDEFRIHDCFYNEGKTDLGFTGIEFANGEFWDLTAIFTKLMAVTDSNDEVYGTLPNSLLDGQTGNDILYGSSGDDTLKGAQGDDVLHGGDGKNQLFGGDGGDVIRGGSGVDIIDGGAGNDWFNGGAGENTYVFEIGSGSDTLVSEGGELILLGNNIGFANLMLQKDYSDLKIGVQGWRDTLTIQGYFNTGSTAFRSRLKFSDGSTWDEGVINQQVQIPSWNEVRGTSANEKIVGTDGHDSLHGGIGNDTLLGGAGDDMIEPSIGKDVIYYNLGDGYDTLSRNDLETGPGQYDILEFGAGIRKTDLLFSRQGSELLIKVPNGSVSVSEYYYRYSGDDLGPLQGIKFSDGDLWSNADIGLQLAAQASFGNDYLLGYTSMDTLSGFDGDDSIVGHGGQDSLMGGSGNDTLIGELDKKNGYSIDVDGVADYLDGGSDDDVLYAGGGSDTLIGGAGNDQLIGGLGSDVYKFGRGMGLDEVFDDLSVAEVNTIQIMGGVLPGELTVSRLDNDLWITIKECDDRLVIRGYFNAATRSEAIKISFDGFPTWDAAAIQNKLPAVADAVDDLVTGTSSNETFDGGKGEDQIDGKGGTDLIVGGMGDDTLAGGDGNDTLEGGGGNDALGGGALNLGLNESSLESYTGFGNDTYRFRRGDGADVIYDFDATMGNVDVLEFLGDIAPDEIELTLANGDDLVISFFGGSDVITVHHQFKQDQFSSYPHSMIPDGWAIECIKFNDAARTVWNLSDLKDAVKPKIATDFEDALAGWGAIDHLNGLGGNDHLSGFAGRDFLAGGEGDDVLDGGADDDWLHGDEGNDTLNGGTGLDTMIGGAGNDDYYVDNGADIIFEYAGGGDADEANVSVSYTTTSDFVEFYQLTGSSNINLTAGSDAGFHLWGNEGSNFITGGDGNDELFGNFGGVDTLKGGKGDDSYYVVNATDKVLESVNEGYEEVQAMLNNYKLPDNVETLRILGAFSTGSGNDSENGLFGNGASNTLYGLGGDDLIEGYGGNDTLIGGKGDDLLSGSGGNDTYVYNPGDGYDYISNNDANGNDTLLIHGATESQIWFRVSGRDMNISIIGRDGEVTVGNWTRGASNQIDNIKLDNGKVLSSAKVMDLVNAMASYAPPALGQTTLPANYQAALGNAIAQNWVSA